MFLELIIRLRCWVFLNKKNCDLNIVNANAVEIPFKDNFFDLIFCVNAIHHFPDKKNL